MCIRDRGAPGPKGDTGAAGTSVAGVITEVRTLCTGTSCITQCPSTAQTAISGTCSVTAGTADFALGGFGILRRTTDGDMFSCTYVLPGVTGGRQIIATAACVPRTVLRLP